MVLTFGIGSWLISDQFIYGHGHAERPIPLFFGLYLVGCVGFILGCFMLRCNQRTKNTYLWILGIGIAARLSLLQSNLIQENDCYRYVLDGECILHLVNPYAYAPDEIIDYAPAQLSEELHSEAAQLILSRIGYPEIPTIYPPLAQLCFGVGALITPWSWLGQRIVFLALDAGTILLIILLLKRLHRPLSWCIIYAWNPLVIKEIANSGHLDSLVGFCLLVLLLFLERWNRRHDLMSAALSGLSLGAAVLAKLYPIILLPICGVYLLRRGMNMPLAARWSHLILFMLCLFGLIIVSYAPFLGVGFDRITEGLRTYNDEWINNEGLFGLILYIVSQLSNAESFAIVRLAAHWLTGLIAVGAAATVYRSKNPVENLVKALQITLLGWLLLLPAVFPWYAVGLIAVSAVNPRGLIVLVSISLGLYYLLFLADYREYPGSWRTMIQIAEHGLIWIGILLNLRPRIHLPSFLVKKTVNSTAINPRP